MLWLLLTQLSFSAADGVKWPPEADTTAILLADEYVEVEMIPPVDAGGGSELEEGATPPTPLANDLINAGTPAESPAPLLTSTLPSPVQVKPSEPVKPSGPSQAEIDAAKARERAEKEAKDAAANRVKFGQTPGATGSGDGLSGSGSGTSSSKSSHYGSGSGNVGGRGISVSTKISAATPGNVYVSIRVSADGKVVHAEINPGKTKMSDPAVREKCLAAARAAKIGKSDKGTEEAGYINFIFK